MDRLGGALSIVEHPFPVGALVPPQLPEVIALADRYGLQFGQPDWLPDLIARYHLTPPPGA